MSAYEDFCGCGEWSCKACHGSDSVKGSNRNAHVHGLPPSREDKGDPIVVACAHYLAIVKDPNAKPRHINRARAAVIQAAVRGMDDAQIADVLAFGRVQEACANG